MEQHNSTNDSLKDKTDMRKKLDDYLHLYMGCDVMLINDISEDYEGKVSKIPELGSIGKLALINDGTFTIQCADDSEEWAYGVSFEKENIAFWDSKDFKLILRHLEDMTVEEAKELICEGSFHTASQLTYFQKMSFYQLNADQYRYLLSKHFDVFNLIEQGLAIDAKQISDTKKYMLTLWNKKKAAKALK